MRHNESMRREHEAAACEERLDRRLKIIFNVIRILNGVLVTAELVKHLVWNG